MTQTESGADSGSFPKDARAEETETRGRKGPLAFRTISEVAEELNIPQHVLRFWETRFEQVRPLQFGPGGRRHYRPDDVALLRRISNLIYVQGHTLKGAQRVLNGLTDEPTESPPEPEAMLEDAIPQAVEGAPILDIVELVEEAPVYSAPYAPEPQAPTPVVDDSAKREVERLRSGLTNILIELEALRRHFG